jgi:Cellulase (glycosyl hydrolase family 5)
VTSNPRNIDCYPGRFVRHRRPAQGVLFSISVAILALSAGVSASASDQRASDRVVASQAAAARPLHTAIHDDSVVSGAERAAGIDRLKSAGSKFVRIPLSWRRIAPSGATMPAGFNPRDPGDPRYRWGDTDAIVRDLVARGISPILALLSSPDWAESRPRQAGQGAYRPLPTAYADFATAISTRYSGRYQGLPRVRYWQVWNEPNLSIQLMPQSEAGKPVSPDWYRSLVNALAGAVHAVRADNLVVAGGLAPFGGDSNDPSGGVVSGQERIRPLEFMRQMLCVSGGAKPKKTCSHKTDFDIWAHHPYTYGGPTHSAFHKDDVSIGDLGVMRKLLDAARKARQIRTRGDVAFWVTEFSYDSQPADPKGLAPELHARWVSEALYRMWSNGVSLVTWFLLRDEPFPDQMFQSGLYVRGYSGIATDVEKPSLRSFRFPFVAFRNKNKSITYWGRSPSSARAKIVLEQRVGKRWKRVSRLTTNRYGIFMGKLAKVPGGGPVRARLANGKDFSHGFSLRPVKDFRFCPWGSFC